MYFCVNYNLNVQDTLKIKQSIRLQKKIHKTLNNVFFAMIDTFITRMNFQRKHFNGFFFIFFYQESKLIIKSKLK